MERVYTVTEIHSKLLDHVETLFPFVWIQGEVTNLSRSSAGHLYFSLKDACSVINCVWFFSKQRHNKNFDILTGELLEEPQECVSSHIKNGDILYCAGIITLYKSSHQIIIDLVEYIGEGLLHRDYMLLKIDLESIGAFSLERKRPLPKRVQKIALITALNGAAIQDFLVIASERGIGSEIVLYDVTVQGELASFEIQRAIRDANEKYWADTILIMRGGGGNEDLSIFNSKEIAEAIFNSTIHVLAAIGHEVDHSFADMIADTRAATPSHAAHLLWKTRTEEYDYLFSLKKKLNTVFYTCIGRCAQKIQVLANSVAFFSPHVQIAAKESFLENIVWKLRFVLSQIINKDLLFLEYMQRSLIDLSLENRIFILTEMLCSFASTLENRVYLYLERKEDSLNTLVKRLEYIRFSNIISQKSVFFVQKLQILYKRYQEYIFFYEKFLNDILCKLYSKNPMIFLEEGYARLENIDGTKIQYISDIQGERVKVKGNNFSLLVDIIEIEVKEEKK
ncbi:MAG: exodeoxyribonuclease VII large subunit [Desulfovibrionaceae bacterium]